MDDFTLALLKLFKERQILTLSQLGAILNVDCLHLSQPIHFLIEQGYLKKGIEIPPTEGDLLSLDTPIEITYKGIVSISLTQKEQKYFKYNEVRAWITLSISIAAFLLSVLSLYLKY
ncbi:MAG: hypothetical protein KH452_06100 [Clostridiales bacterium]|nr:hypothetical protein [Clostridiales bacterium]